LEEGLRRTLDYYEANREHYWTRENITQTSLPSDYRVRKAA